MFALALNPLVSLLSGCFCAMHDWMKNDCGCLSASWSSKIREWIEECVLLEEIRCKKPPPNLCFLLRLADSCGLLKRAVRVKNKSCGWVSSLQTFMERVAGIGSSKRDSAGLANGWINVDGEFWCAKKCGHALDKALIVLGLDQTNCSHSTATQMTFRTQRTSKMETC